MAVSFISANSTAAQSNEAEALHNQVVNLYRAGKYREAIPIAERVLALREKSLGQSHPDVALALNNLALLYKAGGRYADAEPLYKRASTIYEATHGQAHPYVAASLNNLAGLYDSQFLHADSEPLYKRALAIYEKALGSEHRNVAIALNNLALHYYAQGRYAEAEVFVRRTFDIRSADKVIAFPVLFESSQQHLISGVDAFDLSFELAQRVTSSATVDALSRLATRFASGSDKELSFLVRKDQDLSAEAERLNKGLLAAVSKVPSERNTAVEDQIRRRLDAAKLERGKLQQAFDGRYPDYGALYRPQPLSLKETQALLGDDEALIIFDFDARSYAWIVTRITSDWVELNVSADTITAHVKALRSSIMAEGNAFDAFLARWIYRETFGVFSDKIASTKRLSIVTNGALAGLPLHLLVTNDPYGKEYKDIDWFARSHSITIWPSVANLRSARSKTVMPLAPKPLIAFANPVLSRNAIDPNRNVNTAIGQETRERVDAIAKALNADPSDIKVGLAATKSAVTQGRLNQYRVVYFATHCVAGDQIRNLSKSEAEPALALTGLGKRNDVEDGFLYMSEVAQLKLSADWVILSACGTTTSDGIDAQAQSDFARAFLYAGGRSIVASHWEVNDVQSSRLIIDALTLDEKLTSSQALQQSMLKVLANAKSNDAAHPRQWAPFVITGEPLADTADRCFKESGDLAIGNCSQFIASGRYQGRKLAGLYETRGLEYRKKGQYERSTADYSDAIRLDPDNASAYANRCYLRVIVGQLHLAVADCNTALRLSPEDALNFEYRGLARLKLGQFDLAIADYDGALQLNPDVAPALYGRGIAKQRKGDSTGGDADIAAAKAIASDVTEQFAKLGFQPTAHGNFVPENRSVPLNNWSPVEDRHGVVH